MCTMPKAFPKEFRQDVIRVYRDSAASMAQVAKNFGISASCLALAGHRRAELVTGFGRVPAWW
jgi:transposase-like protein